MSEINRAWRELAACMGRGDKKPYAESTGHSHETVRRWCRRRDGDNTGTRSPLDWLTAIMETALRLGRPRDKALAPLRYLCDHFGITYIDVGEYSGEPGELTERLLSSIEEFGQMAAAASDALKDRRIEPDELERIQKEGREARNAIEAFLRSCEQAVTNDD